MDLCTVINASFLCVFNAAFMIAGIFLNSVVITSLWRTPQLRKKLCYFMILLLSCVDLAVVAIMHPIQISSTISVALGKFTRTQEVTRFYIAYTINGLSMFALLVLTIERFLALTYPYFHQTAITKRRLIFLLVAFVAISVPLLSLSHTDVKMLLSLLSVITIPFLLLLLIHLNYKMFIVARSKRDNETVAKSSNQERKRPNLRVKLISTCLLTVVCYFVCSCPYLVYSALRLTSNRNTPYQELVFYNLWSSTCLYEFNIQLSDIFLEKFNSSS